jgi:hypothetical protein
MSRLALPATAGFGLAVLVAGTFLPWLHSGSTTRNSYQAGGLARRVIHVPGWLSGALVVWPFIGLVCAGVITLYAVALARSAALLGLLIGAGALAVSSGALAIHGNGAVAPAGTGPTVTIFGASVVMAASSVLLLEHHHRSTRS